MTLGFSIFMCAFFAILLILGIMAFCMIPNTYQTELKIICVILGFGCIGAGIFGMLGIFCPELVGME